MRAQGGGNGETHFSVLVVSEVFDGVVRFAHFFPGAHFN